MNRPKPGEYAVFYATYIDKIGDEDIIDLLEEQNKSIYALFKSIPANKADYAYAPDKWTIKEVLGHMIDTERIMTYRALRFSRGDGKDLPGFEQDDYVRNSRYNERQLLDIAKEFKALRESNLIFFKSLNDEEKQRGGMANGNSVNVNALLYIIAGHAQNHIDVLKEKYLVS